MNDRVPASNDEPADAALAVDPPPLPRLLSRERAILAFNRRVLAQAQRADVPLLERLRYVTIVSSNMDEFFEVRFTDVPGGSAGHRHCGNKSRQVNK